jgi:general secretion pathway protein N
MRFFRHLILLALLLGLFLLVRAPAAWVDRALNEASSGGIRLTQASGTLWQGTGVLRVIDPVSRAAQLWQPLSWSADFSGLWRGAFAWDLRAGGQRLARLSAHPQGGQVSGVQITAPARFILERMGGFWGQARWAGDLNLTAADWRCDWAGHCTGDARIVWWSAASSLLPGQLFGDYAAQLKAQPDGIHITLSTLEAKAIALEGEGLLVPGGALNMSARLTGDAQILSRLPSIGAGQVRPGDKPGQWIVRLGAAPSMDQPHRGLSRGITVAATP